MAATPGHAALAYGRSRGVPEAPGARGRASCAKVHDGVEQNAGVRGEPSGSRQLQVYRISLATPSVFVLTLVIFMSCLRMPS